MKKPVRTGIDPDLKVEIPATDGRILTGALFRPREDRRRSVIIAPAMGVGQTFYHNFARFLVDRGFTVLTFDYRGMGASARGPARSSRASLYDWGRKDVPGVLTWLAEKRQGDRMLWVGHSMGTQILGLVPSVGKIHGLVAVTAPNGYWGIWSGWSRLEYRLIWTLGFPAATGLLGFFPARKLGLGLDLPGGVARDWSCWARNPGYVVDEQSLPVRENFASFRGRLLAYSFHDDRRATREAVAALLEYFTNGGGVDHRHVRPSQFGLAPVGHVGYFRDGKRMRETLWTETADWLAEA
jgi:predicted alpha/beta hydrolase